MPLKLFPIRMLQGCAVALAAAWLCVLPASASEDAPRCFHQKNGGLRCQQGAITCMPDALGTVYCAPQDGGIEVNNYGQPLCGPGYCLRDWKGDVFCSTTPRGPSHQDIHGQPLCTGGCVAGQAALCSRPTGK